MAGHIEGKPDGATIGRSETGDALLVTPGPLTTSKRVKDVMVHDWGSRDAAFLKINREVLERLPAIIRANTDANTGDADRFVTVPMQGSGTFAVEAMLTTFVPLSGKVLLIINGAYGHRAKKILEIARRAVVVAETPEDTPPDLAKIEALLTADTSISHVFVVHCETTSGILNPVQKIATLVERHGRRLLVDAMSAFGAIPLDSRALAAAGARISFCMIDASSSLRSSASVSRCLARKP